MSLREDNTTKLEHQMKPDAMKTGSEQVRHDAKDTLDNIASHLPGQSLTRDHVDSSAANPHHHAHDTGRGGLGTMGASLKPSGEQTLKDKVEVQGDKAGAHLEDNEQKSKGQNLKDAITPGHDSSLTPHNHTKVNEHTAPGEKQGVMSKIAEVKDKVVGAVTGHGAHGEHKA